MAQLNSYLIFDGNCKEAMSYYQECLGGKLELDTVASTPMASSMPAAMQQKIMHSELRSGNIRLMGSDMVDEAGYKPGNTLYLCLLCDSVEELNRLFSSLSAGGKVTSPVTKEFFGTFGSVTDKYGFGWMFMHGLISNQQIAVSR